MVSIKLLGTRLHVCPIAPKLISAGGIHYSSDYAKDQGGTLWRVLGVGRGVVDIAPGNCVLTPSYSHDSATLSDGTKIIEQREVIAVITEEK